MIRGLPVPGFAITLWPEWAFAILYLGKDCENRVWQLAAAQIGQPLLLHAGAYVGGAATRTAQQEGLEGLFHHAHAAGWTLEHTVGGGRDPQVVISGRHADGRVLPRTPIARRAFVAAITFDRCEEIEPSCFVGPADPWAVGPYVWRISRVVALARPVPCSAGAQRVWGIDGEAFLALQPELSAAALSAV